MNKLKEYFIRFNSEYFFSIPQDSKVIFYQLAFFVAVIIGAGILFFYFSKKERLIRGFIKNIFWTNFTFSIIGLFLIFSRYERINLFSWRIWIYTLFAAILGTNLYFYFVKRQQLFTQIEKQKAQARKEKWLTKSKKKRKS